MKDPRLEQTANLIEAVRSRKPGAIDELFRRYLPRVRRIVAARLGGPLASLVELDDVIQETFLDACRTLEQRDGVTIGSFYNWLARAVENNITDQWRRAKAEKRGSMQVRMFGDIGQTTRGDPGFAVDDETPSRIVGSQEFDSRLEQSLLQLRGEFREVVILRILCEMSFDEIARELDVADPATVRQWLSRALKQMRRTLGDEADLIPDAPPE